MKYWLMKSEPDVYSLDQLKKDGTTWWEGVRNFQARNFMTEMEEGDQVLFYHSSCEPPGVAGIAGVSKRAESDKTQFDKKSDYFEPRATKEKPMWTCVQVRFEKKFKHYVSLEDLKKQSSLKDMLVLKKGQRLSVQPVDKKHFDLVTKLGGL